MGHFSYLFAAWTVAWAVFFGYQIALRGRIARLSAEIERLGQELRSR